MDPELLAALLSGSAGGYRAPALSEDALLAAAGGVSRTTMGQIADPSLLLAAGIISPADLVGGTQQYIASQQSEAERKALEDFQNALNDAEIKRVTDIETANAAFARASEPPRFVSEVESRYEDKPLVGGLLSEIFQGNLTAGQAVKELATGRDTAYWMGILDDVQLASQLGAVTASINDVLKSEGMQESDIARLEDDFSQYARDAANYRNRLLDFETYILPAAEEERDSRLAAAETRYQGIREKGYTVPEIDPTQARFDFYKQMGLEGLSFLPDPAARYQFDTDTMLDLLQRRSGPDDLTLAERQLRDVMRAQPSAVRGQSGPTMVSAVREPDVESDLREKYGSARTQLPTGSFMDPYAPRRTTPALTLSNVLASQRPQAAAERAVIDEQIEAMKRSEALGRALAARGRTPFEDSLRRYFDYGIVEAND